MPILKRIAFTTLSAVMAFMVLWMIIVNDQSIALNLIFVQTPAINAGLVILLALIFGLLMGFLLGLLRARWSKPSV